ncbi:TPA: GNAT family N-acetyltransferase [Candidatus Woesearchaeota archaeon]|nr:GNAT family N-acetyltransferase [Candidatus Woesearchaeota archaeon]
MRDIDPCELLRYCPIDVPASIERSGGQYTLMLGDRILAKDRTALPIVPNPLNPFAGDEPSGSIGFLTFVPEPRYLKGSFAVYMLGVERKHRKRGHCGTMLDWCEAAAHKLDLPYVAHINVKNETLQEMLERRGYEQDTGTGFFPMYYKKVGPVHRAMKEKPVFSLDDIPGIGFVKSWLP